MCGIAGWLGSLTSGKNYAERMVRALHHRGPDAHGINSWPEATLVHTRLSIIDLTPTGAQPMSNEDGTIWTVFNGEIYNHQELRHDLECRGHVFRGRADTEVLPHLYEEHGQEFVSKLRGMFAVAIYDTKTRTLILARDRFGIKPLFYAPGRERLVFASEIGAFRDLPDIDDRPNRQAIYDFAALLYIPAPETFYTGIRALEPGEILLGRLNHHKVSWNTRMYHRWSIVPDSKLNLAEATDRADALLTRAVCRQMESDVPLGSLLSGGIDSSLVSLAAQAALRGGLRTFNVRFSEAEYDETWAALSVARHIGSEHETLDMDGGQGTWEHITDLLHHAGQPYADTSLFAVHAVCQLMRRHLKVALSGDGGDEGFGGYDLYWRIARIARWRTVPAPLANGVSAVLALAASFGSVPERLPHRVRGLVAADDTSVVQGLFCWLEKEEHRRLCQDTDLLPVRRLFEQRWEYQLPRKASRLELLSAHTTEIDTRLSLSNDFLFKVDLASMRESLEVRVPMLDEDLFSFGLSLPHALKVKGRKCKRVLREIATHRLPRTVANKSKWGFAIPVDSWVDADFKANLRDALLGPSSRLPEFFRPDAYRPIVEAFCGAGTHSNMSRAGIYQRAIMLLAVELALSKGLHGKERASAWDDSLNREIKGNVRSI